MGSQVTRGLLVVLLAVGSMAGACGREEATLPPPRARVSVQAIDAPAGALALPLRDGSVRFAVIGDAGRGDRAQYEVAGQMVRWRAKFPFDFVLMLGDNIYDRHTPEDYVARFEAPYRELLTAGVTFHAAIGNHDDPAQIFYQKFNMDGRRYYTFRHNEARLAGLAGAGVRFFGLDSRSLDPAQLAWLRGELSASGTEWKICYLHHPLYTSGRYRSGARALRRALEPVLVGGGANVVLSGHEHFYERVQPQAGIAYFISGAAGSLRRGDIRPSGLTAKGFDSDYHFMLMEVTGEELYFQAISRTGETIDAGVIRKSGV